MPEMTIALLIFLFPLAYSPGPGNMFFAAIGARFGLYATISANIGYHIATWAVTFVIGIGAFTILDTSPIIFQILRYSGAIYVLWLAWRFFTASTAQYDTQGQKATFMDGVILLLLNPKAYVIIALMFTQFLPPSADSNLGLVLFITTLFTLNNMIAFIIWALIGEQIGNLFSKSETARWMNTGFALMLAAVAVWMLFI